MKKIYETFTEIARDFKDGENWTHQLSDHTSDECFAWQHGLMEFAEFLDRLGVKIISNPEIYEELWRGMKTYKPNEFTECPKIRVKS